MKSRRRVLQDLRIAEGTHLGLWLDKFLAEQNDQSQRDEDAGRGEKSVHIRAVQGRALPAGYARAFDRWRAGLEADPAAHVATARANGRFVVGLGIDTVLETGVRLDHTWGVPLLPGSALKGLARRAASLLAADEGWSDGRGGLGPDGQILFGDTEDAGAVQFLDAWWVPEGASVPLHQDVMTVHHRDYYAGGAAPPADTDSPNPVAFVTATGAYLVAVVRRPGTSDGWAKAALELLALGLEHLGIGAKTNAGYGRMKLEAVAPASARPTIAEGASESPQRRVERALEKVLATHNPTARREWLVKTARGTARPPSVSDPEWRSALRELFAPEIDSLRNFAAGGDSTELSDARRLLAEHSASMPQGKGPAKEKWRKKADELDKRVKNLERQQANREADRARVAGLLAWLEGELTEAAP